jgi:hypothetical protein
MAVWLQVVFARSNPESRSASDNANIASVARFVLIIPNLFPSTADPDYFPLKFRDLCDFFDGIVIAFWGPVFPVLCVFGK